MAQEHNPIPGDVRSVTRSPEMQEKALRRQVLARGFQPWECPENLGLTRKGIAVVCMSVAPTASAPHGQTSQRSGLVQYFVSRCYLPRSRRPAAWGGLPREHGHRVPGWCRAARPRQVGDAPAGPPDGQGHGPHASVRRAGPVSRGAGRRLRPGRELATGGPSGGAAGDWARPRAPCASSSLRLLGVRGAFRILSHGAGQGMGGSALLRGRPDPRARGDPASPGTVAVSSREPFL